MVAEKAAERLCCVSRMEKKNEQCGTGANFGHHVSHQKQSSQPPESEEPERPVARAPAQERAWRNQLF